MTTLDQLIAAAKALESADNRHRNGGRPKIGFKDDSTIVSKMRQRGHKLRTIYRVLQGGGLTTYNNYSTFQQAWVRHLAD